jgi:hypothetical protein
MPRIAGVARGFRLPRAVVPLWTVVLLCSITGAHAQAIGSKLWITDGTVAAMVQDGSTLYVGGTFSQVGPVTGKGVPIDSTGLRIPNFPVVNGTVYAVASDGSGGYFIGGYFSSVGGIPRNNLAHVDGGKQVTGWNPGPDNAVRALVRSAGVLYVGGLFSNIGGQARRGIAAVDDVNGTVFSWYPGDINIVYALALSGTTLYIGGNFCCIGSNFRSDIGAVDISSGAVKSWNPSANFNVLCLAVSGSTVYAGGLFGTIGGQTRNRIAALDATTGLATSWNPNATSNVWSIYPTVSSIYAGGDFSTIGGQSRHYIAALDPVDGTAQTWNPNASNSVLSVQRFGSKVYAGGDFTSIGGASRNRIAELDATTGSANAWNPNSNGEVNTVLDDGTNIFAGGAFSSLNGVTRNNLAALDLGTGLATAWDPNANNAVAALAISGQTVYAGGQFTNVGGQVRNHIAGLSTSTGLATSWNPNANITVDALASRGDTVYAGGYFTSIGGQARNYLAALDAGGLATSWNPNPNTYVYALATSPTLVYVGGSFTSIGGQVRNNIAALNSAGLATSWNPNASSNVLVLATQGTTIYAGGDFSTIGGQSRGYVAALDAGTGLATAWSPNPDGAVHAMYLTGSQLYLGGVFTVMGGLGRSRLAAIDLTSGSPTAWNPSAGNDVTALVVVGTTVYAGGSFTLMGTVPAQSLAAMNASPLLSSVTPSHGGNAGPVSVTLNGEGLTIGSAISLTHSAQPSIPGTGVVTAADGSSIQATVDLSGALADLWSVVVTQSDGQTTSLSSLSNAFKIDAIQAPQLQVGIVGTSVFGGSPAVRRDRRTAIDLVIENPGNVDAVSVPLWLAGIPTDATIELDFGLSYPPEAAGEPDWSTVPTYFTSASGKYLPIVIPRVPPGTTTRRFYLTVPGPTHPSFQLVAAVAPPWMNGDVFRSCLSPAAGISNPSCMGTQLDAINAYLSAHPGLNGLSGIALWAKIGFQCEGASGLNAALAKSEQVLDYLEASVESGTSSPGCVNVSIPRWRDVQTVAVVGSIDPNQKLGLQGSFSGQTVLPYTIEFENASSATLPAQNVTVTDQINGSVLDLSSLNLGQITFGSHHIDPPPGLTSFATTVDLRPGQNLLVNVSASLDPVAQVVSWHFNSIDPATGRTPTDLNMGFLPPNVTPPQGEGSVLFTVLPKAGLATGTVISNTASILFDDPPAVNTAAWTNGVDNSPPSSNVQPIAAQSNLPSIPVSWTAIGAPPDLRDFTIYVKQDAGPYRVWRLNTPTTSDTLVPPKDHQFHTFSFYSVARDQAGNIEAAPATADASTQSTTGVDASGTPMLALYGARPNPTSGSVVVWFTLPSRERATLELIDVAGRRVARREVGQLGPGTHLVALASPARAGLYFLRLTHGNQELQGRVAVIR